MKEYIVKEIDLKHSLAEHLMKNELIRCKDCVHFKQIEAPDFIKEKIYACEVAFYGDILTDTEGYCYKATRIDEGKK